MLDWSGSHLTASITWSRSMSMPMMRRASPMPKLKNTFTRMFWSPWPFTVNRFNRVVRKGWHKILGPLQKHCQLCENCDMINKWEKLKPCLCRSQSQRPPPAGRRLALRYCQRWRTWGGRCRWWRSWSSRCFCPDRLERFKNIRNDKRILCHNSHSKSLLRLYDNLLNSVLTINSTQSN